MKKYFSIIIPNWNGKKFLKTCLDSIYSQTLKDFEVILVDNGSNDDSLAFVKKNYPQASLIELDKNFGFAGAVNLGIKKAKGELIALLNNDVEVDKNWLLEMKKAANKYPEASFFASKMLNFQKRDVVDSCGDAMTWSGRSYKIGEFKKSNKFEKPEYVFGACAGAAVYRKKMLKKTGLFDSDFFAYLEDVDLDFRAQLLGFKCLFIPDALVYHIGSATAGKKSSLSFKLMLRNHYYLIYKNFPSQKIWRNLNKIFYSEMRFFAAGVRYNFLKEYFWAVFSALYHLPKMRKKRKAIQKNRSVSFDYLDSIIEANFNYKPLKEILNAR